MGIQIEDLNAGRRGTRSLGILTIKDAEELGINLEPLWLRLEQSMPKPGPKGRPIQKPVPLKGRWLVRGLGQWRLVDRYQACVVRYGVLSKHTLELFRDGTRRSATQPARQFANRIMSQHMRRSPQFRLYQRMAGAIRVALKARRNSKRGRRWEELVGYTTDDLSKHLESRFQPGMTWANMGKWHIDHIRPQSSFTYTSTDDPEFRECWALKNLQPLWASDNLRKWAHWAGREKGNA